MSTCIGHGKRAIAVDGYCAGRVIYLSPGSVEGRVRIGSAACCTFP